MYMGVEGAQFKSELVDEAEVVIYSLDNRINDHSFSSVGIRKKVGISPCFLVESLFESHGSLRLMNQVGLGD